MRLFFALWPVRATQKAWHGELASYVRPLGGRRIPAANLHLTLAFLGELPGSQVNTLLRLAEDLPREPITLRFDRIESWKKPGLACLRPTETPAALTRLVGHLNTGLQLAGFTAEARAFKPHVTLVRDIAVQAEGLPVWPVVEWQAPMLALVRSELTPDGAIYHVVGEWPL